MTDSDGEGTYTPGHPASNGSIYSTHSAAAWVRELERGRDATPLDLSYIHAKVNRLYRRAMLLTLTAKNARPHCAECGWDDHRVLVVQAGEGAKRAASFNTIYMYYDWVLQHPDQYVLLCNNCAYLVRRQWINTRIMIEKSNRLINAAAGMKATPGKDLALVNEPFVEEWAPAAAVRRAMERRSMWLLSHPDQLLGLKEHLKRRSDELFVSRLMSYAISGYNWGHISPEILRAGKRLDKKIDYMIRKQQRDEQQANGQEAVVE